MLEEDKDGTMGNIKRHYTSLEFLGKIKKKYMKITHLLATSQFN
jgi:hypothetical protein